MNKYFPLPHEWMLISIIGFFIAVFQLLPCISEVCQAVDARTWGFTLAVFFAMLFIASIVSMTGAGTEEEELLELSIHQEHVRAARHRNK